MRERPAHSRSEAADESQKRDRAPRARAKNPREGRESRVVKRACHRAAEQNPNGEVSDDIRGVTDRDQRRRARDKTSGITRCPPYRSIHLPMKGEAMPAASRPTENPAIASVSDQPRVSA